MLPTLPSIMYFYATSLQRSRYATRFTISCLREKLTKFEEEFRNISISDVSEEELESYFTRIQKEYTKSTGEGAKTRLATLGYLSHFDTLVEKFFPDYVTLFQETLDREDAKELA